MTMNPQCVQIEPLEKYIFQIRQFQIIIIILVNYFSRSIM